MLKGGAAVTVDVGDGVTLVVGTGGVGVGVAVPALHGMLATRDFVMPALFCGAPGSAQTKSLALLWVLRARCKLWPSALLRGEVGVPIRALGGPL